MSVKVDSGGVTLDVDVVGEGRPVVMVHGFPDTKRIWSRQVSALVDAGFQVITYDTRGFGASDKPAEIDAYSIVYLAMDVVAILDRLELEQAHLVGHDFGAATAWATAALAPTRVDHLVTMSVGHPTSFATAGIRQRQRSWYMLLFQFEPVAEQWLTMNDGANFREWSQHPDFEAVYAELLRDGSLTPGLRYYRANVHPEVLVRAPVELPPIQSPTMGVWSSNDFALLESQMTGSAAYCANGFRYERVDGVGHWLQWDAPDAVNALLLDFLPH